MPTVTIHYPRGLFDLTDKLRFMRDVSRVVAEQMDAVDPSTGESTNYGAEPEKFIDFILVPYDSDDVQLTAMCVGTIVSYDWPDRMATIAARLENITLAAARFMPHGIVPEGMDAISFTFLGKQPGCWFAAAAS